MNGPSPIALADFGTWSTITGNALRRQEITILRRMDAAFVQAVADEHETMDKPPPLTSADFRGMFGKKN
jgi:hypothetical protein